MTWSLDLNHDLGVVETVYSGSVSGSDLRQAMTEAVGLGMQNSVELGLIDCSSLEQACDVAEVYDLPSMHSQLGLERSCRIAIILPTATELHPLVEFYEDVCVNRGWSAKRFSDRENAVAWLLSGHIGDERE